MAVKAQQSGEGLSRNEKCIIATGSVVGVIVIVGLVYFLFLRDGWERQHRETLLAMKSDADQLVQNGKLEDGKEKYEELFRELGDHKVRDVSLQNDLDAARESLTKDVTEIQRRADRLRQQEEDQRNAQRQVEIQQRQAEAARAQKLQQAETIRVRQLQQAEADKANQQQQATTAEQQRQAARRQFIAQSILAIAKQTDLADSCSALVLKQANSLTA